MSNSIELDSAPIRYSIKGLVQKNLGRGTKLGYPTANLKLDIDIPDGIYAATVFLNGVKKPSLAFVGAAETFGDKDKKLEVYILDFSGDLYGQEIVVDLTHKFRDNIKFNSERELIEQMKEDEQAVREYFEGR